MSATQVTEDISVLFEKYGTDKRNCGYGHIYHALLYSRRESIQSVLEVGIGTMTQMAGHAAPHYRPGGSLRAWRDFFPNATVLGLDIASEVMFSEDRIVTKLCDSTDAQSVDRALGDQSFDLIVDDGSHVADHQSATLRHVYPYLRPGGIYVIEDIPLVCHWAVARQCSAPAPSADAALTVNPKRIRDIIGHNEFFFAGAGGHCCVIFNQPMSPYDRTGY